MISYGDALELLLASASALASERCGLGEVCGRVMAADVTSAVSLPPFDHAAMDGYALRADAHTVAGSEHPVAGSQAAGDAARRVEGGGCEIMTGALLPQGTDAVIAVERTELVARDADGFPARIRLLDALECGHNVRRAGSDMAPGTTMLVNGGRVQSRHVMLLAALGVDSVSVVRRARIAVIATGNELQGDPAQPLASGCIRASNGPYLEAALREAGAQVLFSCSVVDTEAAYLAALQRAEQANADLVLSTGAVSMGRHDCVPAALRQRGASVLFHHVAMRPGKPLLAARLPQGPMVLALPGTPVAVAVGLRFFVQPLLRRMQGRRAEPLRRAVLDTAQEPRPGMRHFLRATLHQDDDARLHASVSPQQAPYRILPLAQAQAWVVLPEQGGPFPAGAVVEVAGMHDRADPAWPAPSY